MKDDLQIVQDALDYGLLIYTCLGCGGAVSEKEHKISGIRKCNDCPCGTGLTWNPKALAAIKAKKKKKG